MSEVKKGSTNVTKYFKLVHPTTGVPVTGLTITDLDMSYTRKGSALIKADAAALGSVDAAHADNSMIEVDATNSPGLHRTDWPDAAFVSTGTNVDSVILTINGAAIDPADLEIELVDNVESDSFGILNNGTYGNAQLVRSTTPANSLNVNAIGEADADITSISGDSTAADNLESGWDGTGVVGDNYPATQEQVGSLAIGAGGVALVASLFTPTTVSIAGGTIESTKALDGVVHDLDSVGENLDVEYEFDVLANGILTSFELHGYINTNNDSVTFSCYDWVSSSYKELGIVTGTNGSTIAVIPVGTPTSAMTGTGANIGRVLLKITSANGASIKIDYLLAIKTIVAASAGYDKSSVWVDEDNGTSSGTTAGTDGIVTNRSDDFDNAQTIATNLGYTFIQLTNGNIITLSATINNFTVNGESASVVLGSQNISNTRFNGPTITGIATAPSGAPVFDDCFIGACTLPPTTIAASTINGTLTIGSVGNYTLFDCASGPESTNPTIDLNSIGNVKVVMQRWAGSLTFVNITAGDTIEIDGVSGGIISINGTGGEIKINGIFEEIIDLSSGSVTITQIATINRRSNTGYANSAIWVDTTLGTGGTQEYVNGTADNPVDNVPDALVLAASVGLTRFEIGPSSTIVLPVDVTSFVGIGANYDLILNGAIITNAVSIGGTIFGDANLSSSGTKFIDGHFSTSGSGVGLTPSTCIACGFRDEIRILVAGTYTFENCYSEISGLNTPSLNFTVVGATFINFRHYSGGIEIKNMAAGDVMSVEGNGQLVINATCTGGTIAIRGNFTITDNVVGGFVAGGGIISNEAMFDHNTIIDDAAIDVAGLNGDAMRGTDGANTVVPDAAGVAPTAVEIRTEMDNNSTKLDVATSTRSSHSAADVWAATTRTLTSFGTLVATIWANVTRTLTAASIPTGGATEAKQDTIITNIAAVPTAAENRIEMDANSTRLATIFADTDFLQKIEDGEWELVSPDKLYFYEKGTRTGPGTGTILRTFTCYDSSGNATVTDIARVE
jgi:hypothetical protein